MSASSAKVFSVVTQQVVAHDEFAPFTLNERLALFGLAVALVLPTVWLKGFVYNHEIAAGIFVIVSLKRIGRVFHLIPLLAALLITLLLALMFPTDSSTFDWRRSVAVYFKLCLFITFIYALVQRCRNPVNAVWLMRYVILPVGLLLGFSALVDRYTNSEFFVNWHEFWNTGGALSARIESGIDLLDLDANRSAGFATRSYDVVNWALIGFMASYWLKQSGKLKTINFLLIASLLLVAAFSMPHRGALVSVGVAIATFLLVERSPNERTWKAIFLLLMIVAVFVGNAIGIQYDQQLSISAEGRTALSRALDFGMVDEMRYSMILAELDNQLLNPRLTLIGGGWDFGAGVWSKPHNTYLALLIGGGLISVIPLVIVAIILLYRTKQTRGSFPPSAVGISLLMALGVEMFTTGYLYTVLEYPAGTLFMWFALVTIMFQVSPYKVRTDAGAAL